MPCQSREGEPRPCPVSVPPAPARAALTASKGHEAAASVRLCVPNPGKGTHSQWHHWIFWRHPSPRAAASGRYRHTVGGPRARGTHVQDQPQQGLPLPPPRWSQENQAQCGRGSGGEENSPKEYEGAWGSVPPSSLAQGFRASCRHKAALLTSPLWMLCPEHHFLQRTAFPLCFGCWDAQS